MLEPKFCLELYKYKLYEIEYYAFDGSLTQLITGAMPSLLQASYDMKIFFAGKFVYLG